MSMVLGYMLDVLTLGLMLAYALSLLVAIIPRAKGDAASREREARFRLLLPPIGAFALVALGFLSAFWDAWRQAPDHCGQAPYHHPYLCWLHPTSLEAGLSPAEAVALGVLAVSALLVLRAVGRLCVARWRLGRLAALADAERGRALGRDLEACGLAWPGDLLVVPTEQAVCFVYGLRRVRLVISTAVLSHLSPGDLKNVIAHERAHVARRDAVWRLVGQLASLAHVPLLGQVAYRAWTLAGEAVCDEAAVREAGSSVSVAETLVHFQRLINRAGASDPAAALGVSFGAAGTTEARVRHLLEPPRTRPYQSWLAQWPWLAAPLILWQIGAIHAALEQFLRLLHQ